MKFDNIIKKVPTKDLFPARFAKPGIQPGFVSANITKHTNLKGRKMKVRF